MCNRHFARSVSPAAFDAAVCDAAVVAREIDRASARVRVWWWGRPRCTPLSSSEPCTPLRFVLLHRLLHLLSLLLLLLLLLLFLLPLLLLLLLVVLTPLLLLLLALLLL